MGSGGSWAEMGAPNHPAASNNAKKAEQQQLMALAPQPVISS
jgi:hypothetical protein